MEYTIHCCLNQKSGENNNGIEEWVKTQKKQFYDLWNLWTMYHSSHPTDPTDLGSGNPQ